MSESAIDGLDMALVRMKMGIFEDVAERFSAELKSPDQVLDFAKDLTEWICEPVFAKDLAVTVHALDGLYGELEERIDALGEAVKNLRAIPAAEEVAPTIPEIGDPGRDEPTPTVSCGIAEGREAAPELPVAAEPPGQPRSFDQGDENPQGGAVAPDTRQPAANIEPRPQEIGQAENDPPGLRARFWDLIRNAGTKGLTYKDAYKPLDLYPSFNTQLSSYVSAWRAAGEVVVRWDGNANHKRFWLTEFAPTEPEAPRRPSQREKVLASLTAAGADGRRFDSLVRDLAIPMSSLQSVLSVLTADGVTEFEFGDTMGERRYFIAGMKPPAEKVAVAAVEPIEAPPPAMIDPPSFEAPLQQNTVTDDEILSFLRKQAKIGATAMEIWRHLRANPQAVMGVLNDMARSAKVKATPSAKGMKWFHADFAAALPSYTPPPARVARAPLPVASINQVVKCETCPREFRAEFAGQAKCNICRSKYKTADEAMA